MAQNIDGHLYIVAARSQEQAKIEGMENLGELLLRHRDRIGPAWQELLWIMFPPDPQRISINRAAAYLGKDKRTVARNFRRLEERGVLERQAVPGRAHRYRVLL